MEIRIRKDNNIGVAWAWMAAPFEVLGALALCLIHTEAFGRVSMSEHRQSDTV